MKTIRGILGFLVLGFSCVQAQTQVEPFVPGSTLEGVNYYLPQTALRLVVVVEKTEIIPGEFNKYAGRYLHLNNVATSPSTRWNIKSIEMQPYGVPDQQKAFNIKVKSKTVAPLVGLSSDGILLSINRDATETYLPPLPEGTTPNALLNPRVYMTEEILTAGSTAKMAELCAQEIYDLRESRNDLIKGEASNTPKDGQQLQLMLSQLDRQVEALESLFKGNTLTSTEVYEIRYIPTHEAERDLLFRFSRHLGVLDADNLAGEPVYVSVKSMETLPAAVSNEQVDKKKAKMDKGVYYNVPQRMAVSVFNAEKEFCSLETPMGQFGSVEILSNTLFEKKSTIMVTFFQTTGGTKEVME